MQIIEGLQNLGLNEKQAKIYTHLTQSGQTTAYNIARLTGLKRPTVYVVLEELRLKGLVLKIPHVKKQLFSAKSPSELFAESQSRLDLAKTILPQLLALSPTEQKPKTYLFEGYQGMEEALRFGLPGMEGKELLGFFAHADGVSPELLKLFGKYDQQLQRYRIKVRGLAPDHPSLRHYRESDKQLNREVKVMPFEIYSSDNAIEIGDDFVKIYSNKDLQIVIIENKSITQTFRQVFEMVWNSR